MTSFSNHGITETIRQLEEQLQQEACRLEHTYATSISFEEVWESSSQPKSYFTRLLRLVSLRKIRYKWRFTAISLVVMCVCISMTMLAFPAIGETLRGLSLVQRLHNQGNVSLDYTQMDRKHLVDSVNSSVVNQGIELRVDEVFYDGIHVIISYTVTDTEGKQRIQGSNPGPWLEYDFPGINTQGILIEPNNKLIDPNLLEGTAVISFISDDLPDNMNIILSSKRVTDTMGDWTLNVMASMQKSKRYTQTLYPATSVHLAGHDIQIQKIIFGPISNQITLTGADIDSYWIPSIRMFDDKGRELKHGGESGGIGVQYTSFDPFSEQNPKPAYVTIMIEEPKHYYTKNHSTDTKPKMVKLKLKLDWK